MKTIYSFFTLILGLNAVYAQTYSSDLDIVYINAELSEEIELNEFQIENELILKREDFNIRKAIRQARKNQEQIQFLSNLSELQLKKVDYYKLLKKAANKSESAEQFTYQLVNYIPELRTTIESNDSIKSLYAVIRKDTFNGRLDALPSVL